MILALAGGVGGAKLAAGLARCLPPERLLVAVNTGDDFEHLGFAISPDLDTVMYWLAGRNDVDRGWGLAGESWTVMAALEALGGPTWFRLGDRDLATHIERTRRLAAGDTLSAVTRHLTERMGVRHAIVPMSDDRVRTIVETTQGRLPFQDYFVRLRGEPKVLSLDYTGAAAASPSPAFAAALRDAALEAIVLCPSNPLLSIAPILAVGGVRQALATHPAVKVAVSPIIAGQAVKGPAARNLVDLGLECSARGIARFYRGLIDGLVIDERDRDLQDAIEALGIRVHVAATVMKSAADQRRLAETALAFARDLSSGPAVPR